MARPKGTKYIETPERLWYVYAHIKEDKTPFYIGIGKKLNFKRAFQITGRNNIWRKIQLKHNCISNILFTNLSHKEACEIEINLIKHFGRLDLGTGTLCNLTDGGEGNLGTTFTVERINKIRIANTGKKHCESTLEKFRNRKQTEFTKNKIRLQKIGLKASEETKIKMSKSSMGKNNPACIKRRKRVVDSLTGEIYESATYVANILGYSKSYFIGMLNGRYCNKTNMIYG